LTRPTDPELAALLRELANNIDSFGADGLDLADHDFGLINRARATAEQLQREPQITAEVTWNARRSGRTTRMLAEAVRLSQAGHVVYVVAASTREAARLEDQLGRDTAQALGIKFETPGSLGNLDWERACLRGAHPNCRVLFDHHALFQRFGPILYEFHRFDVRS
jgi:hypothetical protein